MEFNDKDELENFKKRIRDQVRNISPEQMPEVANYLGKYFETIFVQSYVEHFKESPPVDISAMLIRMGLNDISPLVYHLKRWKKGSLWHDFKETMKLMRLMRKYAPQIYTETKNEIRQNIKDRKSDPTYPGNDKL